MAYKYPRPPWPEGSLEGADEAPSFRLAVHSNPWRVLDSLA